MTLVLVTKDARGEQVLGSVLVEVHVIPYVDEVFDFHKLYWVVELEMVDV